MVGEFVRITASQHRLYFTADAEVLLDAVLPHLRLGIDLLIVPQVESSDFRAMARAVAQTALLAARMAFFDLGDVPWPRTASPWRHGQWRRLAITR